MLTFTCVNKVFEPHVQTKFTPEIFDIRHCFSHIVCPNVAITFVNSYSCELYGLEMAVVNKRKYVVFFYLHLRVYLKFKIFFCFV